jgi:hypothetical protein
MVKLPESLRREDLKLPLVARQVWSFAPARVAGGQLPRGLPSTFSNLASREVLGMDEVRPGTYQLEAAVRGAPLMGNAPPMSPAEFYQLWSSGQGQSEYTFGPLHWWSRQMRNARGVNDARYLMKKKYSTKNASVAEGSFFSNYNPGFGLGGALFARLDTVEQTLGNYRVDILVYDGFKRVRLYNLASRESFWGGSAVRAAKKAGINISPAKNRTSGPAKTIAMSFWWDESTWL